ASTRASPRACCQAAAAFRRRRCSGQLLRLEVRPWALLLLLSPRWKSSEPRSNPARLGLWWPAWTSQAIQDALENIRRANAAIAPARRVLDNAFRTPADGCE